MKYRNIKILLPKILFHRKIDDGFECGPIITRLDTGIYFCKYEYGYEFKISLLGFGIYFLWTNI